MIRIEVTRKKRQKGKECLFLDATESMFCSVKGMSASIDLESSYTSSQPDSTSASSKNFLVLIRDPTDDLGRRHRSLSPHHRSSSNQPTFDKTQLKGD